MFLSRSQTSTKSPTSASGARPWLERSFWAKTDPTLASNAVVNALMTNADAVPAHRIAGNLMDRAINECKSES